MARARRLAVIPSPAPYGDRGRVSFTATAHPYLHCLCGRHLSWGQTDDAALVFACRRCRLIVDSRRVA